MSSEYSLEIENISKQYKMYASPKHRFIDIFTGGKFGKNTTFYALKEFNLKVKKGESIGILGKNGAGKSTLLQILAGIIPPSSGKVIVNGNVSALLELGAGFNPEFSGRENIDISASIYGVKLTESKLQSIIEFADIGNFIEQPVKVYSSGMFIRLAFAIASQMEPDILIVDEALSVGDLQFQTKCLRLIQKLREQGCTFVFVSHSPRMVELFCDRAIWLQDGKVKLDGEPKKVVRAYENFMVGGLDKVNDDHTFKEIENKNDEDSVFTTSGFVKLGSNNHIESKAGFQISEVKVIIDDQVNPHLIISKDFYLILEAKYKLPYEINKALWAIGMFNEVNQPIFHYNTDNSGVEYRNADDMRLEGVIRFKVQVPSVRPGEYLIAIGLDDGVPGNSEVLIHVYDAFKLRVSNAVESPQAGYVQLTNCVAEIIDEK